MTGSTAVTEADPKTLAGVVHDAPFVRLVARDDGDALAAAALLARVARDLDTPYQVRVSADPGGAIESLASDDSDDVSIAIGANGTESSSVTGIHAIAGDRCPASTAAFAVAGELGIDADPVLTLAGIIAAGTVPESNDPGDALEAAKRRDLVDRRPGVAVPSMASSEDLAEGLAASTLFRAPVSGDVEAARAILSDLDTSATIDGDSLSNDDHQQLASLLAVEVVGMPTASERSASALERVLRPYAIVDSEPFATVGGYADVLRALAREAPGTGIALAISKDDLDDRLRTVALDEWRSHGTTVHRSIAGATTSRYDGVFVARVDAPAGAIATVAEVIRDFRSPEPIALVIDADDGRIAAAASEPVGIGETLRSVADEFHATGWGGPTRGGLDMADVDDERDAAGNGNRDASELLAATREALRT